MKKETKQIVKRNMKLLEIKENFKNLSTETLQKIKKDIEDEIYFRSDPQKVQVRGY